MSRYIFCEPWRFTCQRQKMRHFIYGSIVFGLIAYTFSIIINTVAHVINASGNIISAYEEITIETTFIDIVFSPIMETFIFLFLWYITGRSGDSIRRNIIIFVSFIIGWLSHGADALSLSAGMAFSLFSYLLIVTAKHHSIKYAFALTAAAHMIANIFILITISVLGSL